MAINTQMNRETTSWNVPCRTCQEQIELHACPYISFGSGASMKPGAIRCSHGHHHIYFPRDFGFVPQASNIADQFLYNVRAA